MTTVQLKELIANTEANIQAQVNFLDTLKAQLKEEEAKQAPKTGEIVRLEEDEQYFVKNVKFANLNKNNTIQEYRHEVYTKNDYFSPKVKVIATVELSVGDFNHFSNNLLEYGCGVFGEDILKDFGGCDSDADLREVSQFWEYTEDEKKEWMKHSYTECLLVTCGKTKIYLDSQGYDYARYIGIE